MPCNTKGLICLCTHPFLCRVVEKHVASRIRSVLIQNSGAKFSLLLRFFTFVHACTLSPFSRVWIFETLWTVAHQAPLPMGFSKQGYWSGLLCPPSGDLPDPGTEPASLKSPVLAGSLFTASATWDALFTFTNANHSFQFQNAFMYSHFHIWLHNSLSIFKIGRHCDGDIHRNKTSPLPWDSQTNGQMDKDTGSYGKMWSYRWAKCCRSSKDHQSWEGVEWRKVIFGLGFEDWVRFCHTEKGVPGEEIEGWKSWAWEVTAEEGRMWGLRDGLIRESPWCSSEGWFLSHGGQWRLMSRGMTRSAHVLTWPVLV